MRTIGPLEHWLGRHWWWLLVAALGLAILDGVVLDALLRYSVWGGVPGILVALLMGSVFVVLARRRSHGFLGSLVAALLLAPAVYFEFDQRPYQFGQVLLNVITLIIVLIAIWRIL